MRYMTDASLADMAPELRERGIDCETVHKLMRGNESSQERISDREIAQFLRDSNGAITLIVMDHDLAEHCKHGKLSHVRVQDAVAYHVLNSTQG
jgi:hypothetical protein